MKQSFIFFTFFFAWCAPVFSQQTTLPDSIKVGYRTWVDVVGYSRKLESIRSRTLCVVHTEDSSVVFSKGGRWYYPQTSMTENISVENIWEIRYRPYGQRTRYILGGGLAGFVLGGLLGYATYKPCNKPGWGCLFYPQSNRQAAWLGAIVTGIVGIEIGAITGSVCKTIPIRGKRANYAAQREKLRKISISGQ